MQLTAGLYYPYIHFRDEQWLRLAALYWERMARIVPQGHVLSDSEDVRLLAEEEGFVRDVRPSEPVRARVGDEFRELIREKESALRPRYGIHLRRSWPIATPQRLTSEEANARLAWIHIEKIDHPLKETLVDSGLGLSGRGADMMWLGMHPRLAAVYMSALAEAVGYENVLSPVTDEAAPHVAVGGWPMSRLAQALLDEPLAEVVGPGSLSDALAVTAIRYVIPADLGSLPMAKLVEVRRRYAGELAVFRQHMTSLADDLSDLGRIPDPALLSDHLTDVYRTRIEPSLRELQKSLQNSGIDTTLSAMNLQLNAPTLLTVAATGHPLVAAGGALVAGTLPLVRGHRRARHEQTTASPVAYLLHAQQGLSPQTLFEKVRVQSRRFLRRGHASAVTGGSL